MPCSRSRAGESRKDDRLFDPSEEEALSGLRIRTIKPEWLDDERLAMSSSDARTLSVALILLADDYGRGRAGRVWMLGRVFPGKAMEVLTAALEELEGWFVLLYELDGQQYFELRNWEKHQKVDRPGKPRVPPPSNSLASAREDSRKIAPRAGPGPGPGPGLGTGPGPDPERASPPESAPRNLLPIQPHLRAFSASFTAVHPDDQWVFDQWVEAFGKTGARFDSKRAACLAERRLEGMSRQDAADTLLAAKADDYVTGEKDGQRHDRLSFIFGDRERFEDFRDAGRRIRSGNAPRRPIQRVGARHEPKQQNGTDPWKGADER